MAKVTLTDIASGYASVEASNTNNTALETAFDNTLSRDGSSPNQMSANIDMNGYALLNFTGVDPADANFTYTGNWATSTEYVVNQLVSVLLVDDATNGGATYICLVAHTSGTFNTDLVADKWRLFAARGATGATSGDMLAANNLSDVTSSDTARDNLAALKDVMTTRGDVTYEGVSGPAPLAVGTAGQVIASDGTDPVYVWGSGLTYVTKATASASSYLEFINLDQGGYDHIFVGRDLIPGTDIVTLHAQISADSGGSPTYETTNYQYTVWGRHNAYTAGAVGSNSGTTGTSFIVTRTSVGTDTGEFLQFDLQLTSPEVSAYTLLNGHANYWTNAANLERDSFVGGYGGVVQAIKFYFSTGNMASGDIYHFKRKLP